MISKNELEQAAIDQARTIGDLKTKIAVLRHALEEAEYFFHDDFPDGPDGPCCVTDRYRSAYKEILAAIELVKP
jgi:hypothetical protein